MTTESSAGPRGPLGPAPELVGRFVRLRPLTVADAAVTHKWRMSDRARLLDGGAPSVEAQAAWIAARPGNEFNFIIELIEGTPIGMLSLVTIDLVHSRAESARFLIGDEDAAKGVPAAVEAMKLLYELAFDRLGLHRVHGVIAAPNTLMIKWQLYMGMREEGRLRSHYRKPEGFVDAVLFGIMEDEYRRIAAPRLTALLKMGRTPKGSA